MTTNDHLELIKTKCRELLAVSRKRTSGTWRIESKYKNSAACISAGINSHGDGPSYYPISSLPEGKLSLEDAAFITSCAGPAETAWAATIAAINGLQILREHHDSIADGAPDAAPQDYFAACTLPIIDIILNDILSAWPLEQLQ